MKTILILSGTGGVGKTSVLQELKLMAKENLFAMDSTTEFIGSPTRDFYAKEGIENELELEAQSDELKVDFQIRLFDFTIDYYCSKILNGTSSMFICDRCPLDYLAYTLQRGQYIISEQTYRELLDKLVNFFNMLSVHNVFLAELPYPVPWNITDDFRSSGFTKNKVNSLIMSDLIVYILKKDIPNLKYNLYKPAEKQDPKSRAVQIVTWK